MVRSVENSSKTACKPPTPSVMSEENGRHVILVNLFDCNRHCHSPFFVFCIYQSNEWNLCIRFSHLTLYSTSCSECKSLIMWKKNSHTMVRYFCLSWVKLWVMLFPERAYKVISQEKCVHLKSENTTWFCTGVLFQFCVDMFCSCFFFLFFFLWRFVLPVEKINDFLQLILGFFFHNTKKSNTSTLGFCTDLVIHLNALLYSTAFQLFYEEIFQILVMDPLRIILGCIYIYIFIFLNNMHVQKVVRAKNNQWCLLQS